MTEKDEKTKLIKPLLDKRNYEVITLENELEVLIIRYLFF
jgi:secreted Zn-dependent insulinase-like peptidase